MKHKITLTLSLIMAMSICFAQKDINPRVDERVELFTVIAKLAKFNEFHTKIPEKYMQKQNEYFASFSEHPTVLLTKKLRKKNSVSYDAIVSFALHVQIVDGTLVYRTDVDISKIDKRYGKYQDKYLEAVNKFYEDTKFHQFFLSNKDDYNEAAKSFSVLVDQIDLDWYYNIFQKENIHFDIIIGFNFYGGYGPHLYNNDGTITNYSLLGVEAEDSLTGSPVLRPVAVQTLIHEFCHPFCNPFIDNIYPQIEDNAKQIFKIVKRDLIFDLYYGKPNIMLYELFVRACELLYQQEHKGDNGKNIFTDEDIEWNLRGEKLDRFIGIERLNNILNQYSSTNHKSLDDLKPIFIDFYNSIDVDSVKQLYIDNAPQIKSINLPDDFKNVDPDLDTIIIEFDRPMSRRKGMDTSHKNWRKKNSKYIERFWMDDPRTKLAIVVKLEPNTTYKLGAADSWFRDEKYGSPMLKSLRIKFKTAK